MEVDDLANAFDTKTNVSFTEHSVYKQHPRYSKYPFKQHKSNQETRRHELLKEQKARRQAVIDSKRGLKPEFYRKFKTEVLQQKRRRDLYYKDILMLSEWMVDIPDDLDSKYICVPCPVGKRVLVIAENGYTVAYNRKGYVLCNKFPSLLPGGSFNSRDDVTLLDCIWDTSKKTFYILDILLWDIEVYNCETEFRFYWLERKLLEFGTSLLNSHSKNRYKFAMLRRVCYANLTELLEYYPYFPDNSPKLDGILFFHKNSAYLMGDTSPLVLWLKPYMVSDILQIKIAIEYIVDRPPEHQVSELYEKIRISKKSNDDNADITETIEKKDLCNVIIMDTEIRED